MFIRSAQVSDLPKLLEIYNEAVRNTTATFDLEEQTLEQRRAWYSHYSKSHPLLVAEHLNEVVGYSCLSRYRAKPAYDHTVESSVYIGASHWGKGIGTALMQHLLQKASELGHHVVVAGITDGNDASVRLHERLGFQYVGCFREVGFKFGAWQDVHFYQCFLPRPR